MNIHTKLVGAFDAIILSTLVAGTIIIMLALLNPSFDSGSFDAMGKHGTVTIEQIA
ncbi:MAG TPA: hypothetical protein VIU34_18045 [Steroidobacter sp.]